MSLELKTKTFLFILLAFLLGGVGGAYLGKSYFSQPRNRRPERIDPKKYLFEKLQLTPTQTAQADTLVEAYWQNMRSEYNRSFLAHRDTMRMNIRKLLSTEQNKLFDEYIKERDAAEEKDRRRRQ
ncbi:MAG: hypothetical protein V1799_17430 [bacterium]